MRILQITAYYPPSVGGIQFYVQRLSSHLAGHGHHVDVLTTAADGAEHQEATDGDVRVVRCRVDARARKALFSAELGRHLARAGGYDLWHVHIPFHFGLEMAAALSRLHHIPLVATHHGESNRGSLGYFLAATLYSTAARTVSLRAVDSTVFLTESYRRSLWIPESVQHKARVIRTGADLRAFSPDVDGRSVRNRLGIDADARVVLFVGKLSKANRYKGVDYLIRAFTFLREAVGNCVLVVAGDGDWVPELRVQADRLLPRQGVVFAGQVEHSALPAYYAAADVFALPSVSGPENSPVVVFEAMASGRPVVASDLPGVRDVVRQGDTGLLVRPRDVESLAGALRLLLTDPDLRARMGANARRAAEAYSWDECAADTARLYAELLAR